jgi:tRNA dimethylallyltransferase
MEISSGIIPVIVIQGATCSGKTSTSLEFAIIAKQYFPIEIISADSRQVYRKLDIGTAKPTRQELEIVPHHCIDILNPSDLFSTGEFVHTAIPIINQIYQRGAVPCIVGGSSLYIHALFNGIISSTTDEVLRKQLQERLEQEGVEELYRELKEIDSVSAERYSDKNPRRILRALEFYYTNGSTFSEAHKQTTRPSNLRPLYFGIARERNELYSAINLRTQWMFENGIIDETKAVLADGVPVSAQSLNTVGYKECIQFLSREVSLQKAIELASQKTRNYAKRQITWLNNSTQDLMTWLNGTSTANAMEILTTFLKSNSILQKSSPDYES